MRRDSLRITRYHILEKGYIIEKECDCLKKEQELESVFKAIIFISQQYHFIMHGTEPDEGNRYATIWGNACRGDSNCKMVQRVYRIIKPCKSAVV
ncbi:MAG: hypothetical protein ACUVWJ_12505 [Spirochaetota bacterium]